MVRYMRRFEKRVGKKGAFERDDEITFTVAQLRTKFKMCH